MDRLKGSQEGFSLMELVIAIALGTVVLLSASNLMINFGRFSVNVVRAEASLLGSTLGTFEEIVGRITAANDVTIPAANYAVPSIDIRVSPWPLPADPSSHASDIYHTYWRSGGDLYYKTNTGTPPSGTGIRIARNIRSLNFSLPNPGTPIRNAVNLLLEATATSGSTDELSREWMSTTIVMRSRSAS